MICPKCEYNDSLEGGLGDCGRMFAQYEAMERQAEKYETKNPTRNLFGCPDCGHVWMGF